MWPLDSGCLDLDISMARGNGGVPDGHGVFRWRF